MLGHGVSAEAAGISLWGVPGLVTLNALSGALPFFFAVCLFAAAALAWFAYFWRKDPDRRDAVWLRMAVMGGGLASVVLAWAGYGGLEWLGFPIDWSLLGGQLRHAGPRALAIGWVEELAKAVPVLCVLLARRSARPLSGLSLAACAGIGFATAESTLLFVQGEVTGLEVLARAATSPLTHALFAVPWGLALEARGPRRALLWALGFAASASAHGAYDLMVAQPATSGPGSAGLILVLWVAMIAVTERRARAGLRSA